MANLWLWFAKWAKAGKARWGGNDMRGEIGYEWCEGLNGVSKVLRVAVMVIGLEDNSAQENERAALRDNV